MIVRISEGLGNQLFMYANAYSLAKDYNYELLVDNKSGYFKKKNRLRSRKFLLNHFNIKNNYCPNHLKFNNFFKDFVKKILKLFDKYKKNKSFLIEKTDNNKKTSYKSLLTYTLSNRVYIEGHFEFEKYFKNKKKFLQKILTIKKKYINKKNKYINLIKNSNAVSLHIRKDRFTEQKHERNIKKNIIKSTDFSDQSIIYAKKSMNFFSKKIKNPYFFIWSNNFENLEKHFNKKNCIFVKNNNVLMDFYLMSLCKHFAVSGSTFHWMGAWLNEFKNKICTRPKNLNLNPSNNKDFWPKDWIKI